MIKDRVRENLTKAIKNREALKVSTLRMMLAEMVNKEKEKGNAIDEEAAVKIFYTMIKKEKRQQGILEKREEKSPQKRKGTKLRL